MKFACHTEKKMKEILYSVSDFQCMFKSKIYAKIELSYLSSTLV